MHPKAEKFRTVISKYIPARSVEYVFQLWMRHPFHFTVTKSRQSKHGDFYYDPRDGSNTITVNGSLNSYMFLITFIHEIAHYHNYMQNGFRVSPHGRFWKAHFQSLLKPLMNETHFPSDILHQLKIHMHNPKASSDSDQDLTRVLHRYNRGFNPDIKYLESVRPGEKFIFQGRIYLKIENKRTRALCRDIRSGREFLIPGLSNIEIVQ
jgi:SprT protein